MYTPYLVVFLYGLKHVNFSPPFRDTPLAMGKSWHLDKILNRLLKYPDSKIHGANMGLIWGRQDPGGPHVGPMNFAIRVGNVADNVRMIILVPYHYKSLEND